MTPCCGISPARLLLLHAFVLVLAFCLGLLWPVAARAEETAAGTPLGRETPLGRGRHLDKATPAATNPTTARRILEEATTLDLEEAAKNVGGTDRSIILATASAGYLDLLENWAISVHKVGLGGKILFVAQDDPSYAFTQARWPGQCILAEDMTGPPVKKEDKGDFGSSSFNKAVHMKPRYMLGLLLLNYSVLLSDMDMVWLRDPYPHFQGEYDMWVSEDKGGGDQRYFETFKDGLVRKPLGQLCTCFIMARPTASSVALVRQWLDVIQLYDEEEARHAPWHFRDDQAAFNRAFYWEKPTAPREVALLPTTTFPSGCLYFGPSAMSRRVYFKLQRDWKFSTVVVHANWMVGHKEKVKAMHSANLWFVESKNVSVASI